MPKEFQENLESNLQQQLQEVEQRRHDLMPEHQKVQKIQAVQDKRRNRQEEIFAADEEMRKLQEELKQREERGRRRKKRQQCLRSGGTETWRGRCQDEKEEEGIVRTRIRARKSQSAFDVVSVRWVQ